MKAVVLCGGAGTRIRDVSEVLPKPMLPIGNMPILWHILKLYSYYGITDFILCLGYKGWTIKEFFLNYHAKASDICVRLDRCNSIKFYSPINEGGWSITLAETGEAAQTGSRVFSVRKYLEGEERFCVTYGDGVADIDIKKLLKTHRDSGFACTVTGVRPEGRFGELAIDGGSVAKFSEKTNVREGYINGGFMVFDAAKAWDYFRSGNDLVLEAEVLVNMAKNKQLGVYQHDGFWHCCDTPREYHTLNELWESRRAPWRIWD